MAGQKPAAGANAPAAEAQAAAEEVEVVMQITITGLRNGQPWPAVGGSISLPADEAAGYIANGYVKPAE